MLSVEEIKNRNTKYHAYMENDMFLSNGEAVFSVLDFWRYMYSQISGQSAELAEFMVAKALGIEKAENVDYWTAYDLSYQGRRIEVKETEYVHPWNKDKVSATRTFSIAPSNNSYWGNGNGLSRQSDLYVFCLNTNKDPLNPQPLNLDYWDFYVIPTSKINANTGSNQKTITLNRVLRLSDGSVSYMELKEKINDVISKMATE